MWLPNISTLTMIILIMNSNYVEIFENNLEDVI